MCDNACDHNEQLQLKENFKNEYSKYHVVPSDTNCWRHKCKKKKKLNGKVFRANKIR